MWFIWLMPPRGGRKSWIVSEKVMSPTESPCRRRRARTLDFRTNPIRRSVAIDCSVTIWVLHRN